MRRVRLLGLALLLATPLGAGAVDAPHEAGAACSNCHMGHNALGGALTRTAGNFNLCQACHLTATGFGFPWSAADQAVPGVTGTSHSWSGAATNKGATPPAPGTPMGAHLDAGNLKCSTCHDVHQSDALIGTPPEPAKIGTQHVSIQTGVALTPTFGPGSGTMTLTAPAAGATAKGYRIEIVAAGPVGTATFRLSNDGGRTWFGCTAPSIYGYLAYVASPSNACRVAASVPLNDEANVSVAFAGAAADAFQAGSRWDFYVSYPYLRMANGAAELCVECHRNRNMTARNVEGIGPLAGTGEAVVFGTTKFSHPVNEALAKPYDVGPSGILDVNGMTQAASTDANRTNDLALGMGGVVTCLTCHHPHNADSNSLTADPR